MINWTIYEITTKGSPIKGVMFRGRLRKFALEQGVNLLTENATDKENCVRFALMDSEALDSAKAFIASIIPDALVELVSEDISNPVLSKLKVNQEERYTI